MADFFYFEQNKMIYARIFLVIKGFIPFFAFYSNKAQIAFAI